MWKSRPGRLPLEARIGYKGMAEELKESASAILVTFALALVIVFLVLAQFETGFTRVIMLTVPLALAGAVIAISVTGDSLNIYSQIGMIMLLGLMAKNGILIVEFANQLRDQGRSVKEAIYEGAIVVPSGLDDRCLHHLRCRAAGAGHRCRRGKPLYHWCGDSRRVIACHRADPVYHPGAVPVAGAVRVTADAVSQQLDKEMPVNESREDNP